MWWETALFLFAVDFLPKAHWPSSLSNFELNSFFSCSSAPNQNTLISQLRLSPPLGHLLYNMLCSSHHQDMLFLRQTKRMWLAPGHSTDLSTVERSSLWPPDLHTTAARAGKGRLWLTRTIHQDSTYSFNNSTATRKNHILLFLVFSNTRQLFSWEEAAIDNQVRHIKNMAKAAYWDFYTTVTKKSVKYVGSAQRTSVLGPHWKQEIIIKNLISRIGINVTHHQRLMCRHLPECFQYPFI